MNENRFQLSRKEFADKLGISTDNLKKKMKRGHYQSSYIKRDGKYYFAVQEAVRPNQDLSLGTNVPRKRNRGNHFKGKYPNLAFQQKNELRMLAKLKHNVDPEVQDLLPEAVELAKQKKRERLQTALNEPVRTKNYGMGIFSMSNPGYGSKQYLSPVAHNLEPNKFRKTNRGSTRTRKLYW